MMDAEDEAEIEATRTAMEAILQEQPGLSGDALLNLATERAGYDVGMTSVEQCANCGELYNKDYGGEYIDPDDCQDLAKELGVTKRTLLRLKYNHYCDFICLRSAAASLA